jgi:DNA-binding HxlR family transcriptional regulator
VSSYGAYYQAVLKKEERTLKIPTTSLPPEVCHDVAPILARMNDKWSIRITRHLAQGPLRFNTLLHELGEITHKVLTSTLRSLERDGFVFRTVTPTIPPRVDYQLTEIGLEFLEKIDGLARWALLRKDAVNAARKSYDETLLRTKTLSVSKPGNRI